MKTYALSNHLHNLFLAQGEIPSAPAIAEIVRQFVQTSPGQGPTDAEIDEAIFVASNQVCDSYIRNAHDSADWSEDKRDAEIHKWEAARPAGPEISNQEFDAELEHQVSRLTAGQLLAIPGVYEALSEELNNAVLAAWKAENQHRFWGD